MKRTFLILPALAGCLGLASCGLLRAPVTVAGNIVKGTAQLTEAAVTAPVDAYERRKQRKEAEKDREETKSRAARGGGPSLSGESPSMDGSPSFGSDLPTLPDPVEGEPLVPVGDE